VEEITLKSGLVLHNYQSSNHSNDYLIIASATGVKQRYYAAFARWLSTHHAINVISFDYMGIGKSNPVPQHNVTHSAQDWSKIDLNNVIRFAKDEKNAERVSVLGHSIGGQIIGLCPRYLDIDRITIVAGQSGYWKHWQGAIRYKMALYWFVLLPIVTSLFGYLPAKLFNMENLPKNMAMEWSKWCKSPNYLFDHLPETDLYYSKLAIPLSAISIDDDHFAPKVAVDWIASKYSAANLNRIHLKASDFDEKSIGHFGPFKKKYADKLWPLLAKAILFDEHNPKV
jgi:predicted alpha/beta hydrolase